MGEGGGRLAEEEAVTAFSLHLRRRASQVERRGLMTLV